jgi:hypothetical protein
VVIWIIVAIVLMFVAGAIVSSSPSMRLWNRTQPGEPGAVDPTGAPLLESREFEKPPNEGDLL